MAKYRIHFLAAILFIAPAAAPVFAVDQRKVCLQILRSIQKSSRSDAYKKLVQFHFRSVREAGPDRAVFEVALSRRPLSLKLAGISGIDAYITSAPSQRLLVFSTQVFNEAVKLGIPDYSVLKIDPHSWAIDSRPPSTAESQRFARHSMPHILF